MDERDIIDIYKEVLLGVRKTFPKKFWLKPYLDERNLIENKRISVILVKFLLEDVLKFNDDEDVYINFSKDLLIQHKLGNIYHNIFNQSIFEIVDSSYPKRFKLWEFSNINLSKHFWSVENGKCAIMWLLDDILKLSDTDVYKCASIRFFKEFGLDYMIRTIFNGSVTNAICSTYPEIFKVYLFNSIPRRYWDDDNNVKNAIYDVIGDSAIVNITRRLFIENGLASLYDYKFKGTNILVYEKLTELFPNKYFVIKKNKLIV